MVVAFVFLSPCRVGCPPGELSEVKCGQCSGKRGLQVMTGLLEGQEPEEVRGQGPARWWQCCVFMFLQTQLGFRCPQQIILKMPEILTVLNGLLWILLNKFLKVDISSFIIYISSS